MRTSENTNRNTKTESTSSKEDEQPKNIKFFRLIENPMIQSELRVSRKKVKINLEKKRFLAKLHQKRSENRRNSVLKQRAEVLAKYRIDYMPLCFEEDLEVMAFYMSQSQQRKSS